MVELFEHQRQLVLLEGQDDAVVGQLLTEPTRRRLVPVGLPAQITHGQSSQCSVALTGSLIRVPVSDRAVLVGSLAFGSLT